MFLLTLAHTWHTNISADCTIRIWMIRTLLGTRILFWVIESSRRELKEVI